MAFTDNFNRANANLESSATASGGGNWVHDGAIAGAAAISSNILACATSDGTGSAYKTPSQGSSDHYVQYKVNDIGSGTGPFAACRLTDRNNFIGVRTGADGGVGVVQVYRKVGGSMTSLYSSAVGTVVVGDIIRLECSGTNFTVKKNGSVLTGPTAIGDASLTASDLGVVMRVSSGAYFDDFEAGALTGGAITGTLASTLAAVTVASNADLLIRGSLAATLAPVTLAGAGSLVPLVGSGVLAATLGPVTVAGSGSLVALVTVYVDSVGGNDANPGTSSSAAKKSIAGITFSNGMTLKVKCGSHFRETLSASGISNVTVEAYGSGLLPVFDGADVMVGAWTRPDAAGNPNVWALTVSHGGDLLGSFASLWEDDARLQFVTSRALCNATAGTFCVTGSSTGVYGASTTTFEIHATGSGNPNLNGLVYEYAARGFAIATGAGWIIRNLRGKRNGHNNGSIAMGNGSAAYGCIAEDGVKHNWYVGLNCTLEDCIVYNLANPHPSRDNWTGFVSHESDASGATSTYTRCKVIVPKAVLDWKIANGGAGMTAFYVHSDGAGGHNWSSISYTDCVAEYAETAFSVADTNTFSITRPRIAGCLSGITVGSSTNTIVDPWIYQQGSIQPQRAIQTGNGTTTIDGARIWQQTNENTGQIYHDSASGLTTVSRSGLCRTGPGGSGYVYLMRSEGSGLSMTGCVLFGANTGFGETGLKRGSGSTRALDYNSYGNNDLDFAIGASNYGEVTTYLAAGTGYDTHSVYSGAANPFTDAPNGDFSLTGASGLDPDIFGLERFPVYQDIPTAEDIANMSFEDEVTPAAGGGTPYWGPPGGHIPQKALKKAIRELLRREARRKKKRRPAALARAVVTAIRPQGLGAIEKGLVAGLIEEGLRSELPQLFYSEPIIHDKGETEKALLIIMQQAFLRLQMEEDEDEEAALLLLSAA